MTNTKAYLRTLALSLMMGAFASGMLQAQVTLNPAWRVTPDTTKPGFKWNYFQAGINTGDNTARTERDLAGQSPNPNQGDPTVIGAAITEAAPVDSTNGLLYFEITNVINLNKVDGGASGYFTPDELEPGINLNVSTDGQAAEILTYLTLPAGTNTMVVVSDDGFQTSSGLNPSDALGRVVLGEYNGSRGAGLPGTLFTFVVQQAGTYPF